MPRQSWYVIQVPTGAERKLCALIERMAPAGVAQECFCPRYATQIKRAGEWVDVEKALLPGYVIVVTNQLDTLVRTLGKIPEFTRLLRMGESFVPLNQTDRSWIEAFTSKGNRCMDMSMGVVEGESVRVLSGPLTGKEALICSINRHKNLAFVQLQICGRTVTTKLGLGIVGSKQNIPRGGNERAKREP